MMKRISSESKILRDKNYYQKGYQNVLVASEDRCHCHIHLLPTPSYPQPDSIPQHNSLCFRNKGREAQRS